MMKNGDIFVVISSYNSSVVITIPFINYNDLLLSIGMANLLWMLYTNSSVIIHENN